jgi:hypothetical protein
MSLLPSAFPFPKKKTYRVEARDLGFGIRDLPDRDSPERDLTDRDLDVACRAAFGVFGERRVAVVFFAIDV